MTHNVKRLLMALAVLASGSALAVAKGGKLYIKTKDAKVFDKADAAKGKTVGTLQPGDEVTWNGADEKQKQFHAIDTGKVKGFTLQQNLSPKKPDAEYLAKDDGKPIDAQAFASSGAATKALSGAALTYSGSKPNMEALAKGLMTAEGVAATVTFDQAREFNAKQTGGAK